MDQLSLFTPRARARKTDNAAAHAAAERVEASGRAESQRAVALAAVRQFPGRTSKTLALLINADRHQLARRLPELLTTGQVCREDTPDGYVWWPVDDRSTS